MFLGVVNFILRASCFTSAFPLEEDLSKWSSILFAASGNEDLTLCDWGKLTVSVIGVSLLFYSIFYICLSSVLLKVSTFFTSF